MNAILKEMFGSLNYSNDRVMSVTSISALAANGIWRMGWISVVRNSDGWRVPITSDAAYPFKEEPDIR